ncbi:uncharacterized membrane protein YcaP (DUF421 family) [Pantoea agglomerans]|uniref:DUF421 domain-containing protein n=1 Tax=Enterobacter agglomerans TaxID=549 RepID=UPI0013BAF956|nr:YetF domain-containing protein [Pantoea agglomerans]MDQ0431008.1 uncharacterized membrane protein YcaP (DUF421 family) [Pantoea agglomerans]NEG84418.1 DUF421 domain-containing protein [Pantoea agglomerans]NEH06343.1 DUF421 domain-containing protein [Pantoea agglomerans]
MEYYGLVLVKFIIGFMIVITHLNLSGKTQLSQMTPIDFIGNFVLGGIIGGVIYSDSIPLYQYVFVLLIGVCLISLLNAISKYVHFFREMTIGQPIPIIKKGRFLVETISNKRNKIDILNVSSQLHAQGIYSFQEIVYAQIEPNGQITAVCEGSEMPSVIIMKSGKAREYALNEIGKDTRWLEDEMKKASVIYEDVFIAEFWSGRLTFILKDGEVKKSHP